MIEGMESIPAHKNELIFEDYVENEDVALGLPKDKRTIITRSADPEIESLYGKYKRGKLILDPDFQRRFVWDRVKASKLIESALLNVPLPIIYLAEEVNGKESVIDGQQRLTSFFSFIDGRLPNGEIFRLKGLKAFSELEGKTYKEIEENFQDQIRYYQIRAITILNSSDPGLKFEIFERLNTGAVPLNNMELRNCVYQGPYMELLKHMALEADFKKMLGFYEPDTRMRDIELVLRFSAFYHSSYLNYKSPMKGFFNADMEKYRYISNDDANKLHSAFKNSLQIVKSLFGENAFKRFHGGTKTNPNSTWATNKFNASLYDVLLGVFHSKDKNRVYAALDSLREGIIDLMISNDDFIDAMLVGTSEDIKVRRRFKLMHELVDEILDNYKQQPRCFSLQLKKELFAKNPTCTICSQQIYLLDDAAIDHIQQYWKGGKTIPENARLTHRYCNLARSRKE